MTKNLTMSMLMDFYGQLLTDKQRDTVDLYYNEDLSLSEIAEEIGISRQGVRDSIKRGERLLNEYEEKLGLAGRFLEIRSRIREMDKIIDALEITGSAAEKLKQLSREVLNEL